MRQNGLFPKINVFNWGWKQEEESIVPLWMTQPEVSKACKELVKCSCKKACGNRCKCKRADLSCMELCFCGSC